jgi:hypothetical protein
MDDQSRNLPALSDASLKADAHRFAEPDKKSSLQYLAELGLLPGWLRDQRGRLRLRESRSTCSWQEIIFHRCPACGERNIVKDGSFTCGSCGADLPADWNFECPT